MDLLGEGKSGTELALAVEAFDRSEAVAPKGEDVVTGSGSRAVVRNSAIGIEMAKLENVERVEREQLECVCSVCVDPCNYV